MSNLVSYQTFLSPEAATPLLALLRQHGIAAELAEDKRVFDPKLAFNPTDRRFSIRVASADVEAARQIEDEANATLAASADPDHYLFGFTDEELLEVLVKPEEWTRFDGVLAGRILRERGRDVSPDALRLLQSFRQAEAEKPETSGRGLVLAGYIFSFLGGLGGILIGFNLLYDKQKLVDGREVPTYTEADRAHGYRMLLISFVVIGLGFLARFSGMFD